MKKRIQCPECGDGYLQQRIASLTGSRKGESFTVDMEALVCPKCAFKTVPRERAAQFALRTANAYRKAHGLLTSLEIKDLRGRLRMTQKQFNEFLHVGEASVKRWELGEIQSPAMDRLIRLSVAEEERYHRPEYGQWGSFAQYIRENESTTQDESTAQNTEPQYTGVAGLPNGPPQCQAANEQLSETKILL
jgi:putative zinc finger/helix-turn-helix YgiT family protein